MVGTGKPSAGTKSSPLLPAEEEVPASPHSILPRGLQPADTVGRLREWLARHRQRRARRRGWTKGFIPTGLERLDAALPGGGVPNGAMTEIYSEAPGVGALTLALRIAASALFAGRSIPNRQSAIDNRQLSASIIFLDAWGDFYPPAVEGFGIDPESLVVIRGVSQRDAFWAVDQCLRCSTVAAVIAPLSRLDERESRRLQLAAESSGAVGLLLRSGQPRGRSFAAVRLLLEGVNRQSTPARRGLRYAPILDTREMVFSDARRAPPRQGGGQVLNSSSWAPPRRDASSLCQITLLSVREGMPADPFVVDLHHATGACDLFSIPGDRPVANIG